MECQGWFVTEGWHVQKMNCEYITIRQEDKIKTTEMIHEWSYRGHGVTEKDEMEADDQLWRPLKGAAKRRKFKT